MAASRLSWPELERDDWVRQSWPARRRTGPNGSASSYSDGTLILTSRRLFFTGLFELDELPVFNSTSCSLSDANDTASSSTL
jgi:hypothetical protein